MFNRLHIYTVHTKPGTRLESEAPVFVREGFSLLAFLFTFLWTLFHRLWLVSVCLLVFNALVMTLQRAEILSDGSVFILLLGMQIVIGFHANDWLRAKLKKRGYITAGIVTGDSTIRAQQRFFEQYTHERAPA